MFSISSSKFPTLLLLPADSVDQQDTKITYPFIKKIKYITDMNKVLF
jgi:hypothetical protein